jgi:hypothetical protein
MFSISVLYILRSRIQSSLDTMREILGEAVLIWSGDLLIVKIFSDDVQDISYQKRVMEKR